MSSIPLCGAPISFEHSSRTFFVPSLSGTGILPVRFNGEFQNILCNQCQAVEEW
jgi:hypothetical protein